jgi:hypothetical protein
LRRGIRVAGCVNVDSTNRPARACSGGSGDRAIHRPSVPSPDRPTPAARGGLSPSEATRKPRTRAPRSRGGCAPSPGPTGTWSRKAARPLTGGARTPTAAGLRGPRHRAGPLVRSLRQPAQPVAAGSTNTTGSITVTIDADATKANNHHNSLVRAPARIGASTVRASNTGTDDGSAVSDQPSATRVVAHHCARWMRYASSTRWLATRIGMMSGSASSG